MPAHGDFVARGLEARERDGWDGWCADMLASLRAAAGDDFDADHVVAPPWRFLMADKGGWTAGALAPSVDGVGRRFLLVLGAMGLDGPLAGAGGLALAAEAEGLIYDGLIQGLSADALIALAADRFAEFEAITAGAAALVGSPPAIAGAWWTLGSERFSASAELAPTPPSDLLARSCPGGAALSGLKPA